MAATKTKKPALKTPGKAAKSVRAVAKVSPVKGSSVDAWIAAKASDKADIVRALMTVVNGAAPKATVAIKWARPVFDSNGPFAFIAVSRAHVTFGFWRGRELTDKKGVLEGEGDRMAHVKVRTAAEIDRPMFTAFVKEAVQINGDKGDPTKRK